MRSLTWNTIRKVAPLFMAILLFMLFNGIISAQTPTPVASPTPTPSPQSLIAYYPFDGDTKDFSGNGYDSSNNGATFTQGQKGQALHFNGKDNYATALVNISSNIMPKMTMVCWARADQVAGTVISQDNGGFKRNISIDDRGGGLGWSCFSGSGGVLGYSVVNTGEWVFLAAVYDQPDGKVTLYVNDAAYEKDGKVDPGLNYIDIGRNPVSGSYFAGTIDEVRIYNYALSAIELTFLRTGVGITVTDGKLALTIHSISFVDQITGGLLGTLNIYKPKEENHLIAVVDFTIKNVNAPDHIYNSYDLAMLDSEGKHCTQVLLLMLGIPYDLKSPETKVLKPGEQIRVKELYDVPEKAILQEVSYSGIKVNLAGLKSVLPPSQPIPKIGQVATGAGLKIIVNSISFPDKIQSGIWIYTPKPGNKLVLVNLTVKNRRTLDLTVNPISDLAIQGKDATYYKDAGFIMGGGPEGRINLTTLPPEGSVTGTDVFSVPLDMTDMSLVYIIGVIGPPLKVSLSN